MHISKKQFYIVSILFLLMPLSVQWRLMVFGEKTNGIVVRQTTTNPNIRNKTVYSYYKYSVIQFKAGAETIEFYGPEDLLYPIGKEINILYNPSNHKQYIMLTFAGLILSNKMLIPAILFIVWLAFYLTVRQVSIHRNWPSGRRNTINNNRRIT